MKNFKGLKFTSELNSESEQIIKKKNPNRIKLYYIFKIAGFIFFCKSPFIIAPLIFKNFISFFEVDCFLRHQNFVNTENLSKMFNSAMINEITDKNIKIPSIPLANP